MTKLMVHHRVGDYAAWRPGFDAHKSSQTGAGLSNGRVYRGVDDPNDIVILFDVADKAKAQAWMKGDDLKTAMQKSGVVGAAAIHFID